jgi:hypothetical protein
MCRYASQRVPYRQHCACFTCRKSWKWPHDATADLATLPEPRCPQCRGVLEPMGLDFKAPPHGDVAQWEKVRILAAHGIRFFSCGCGGPGPRPEDLRDVEAFLRDALPRSEGERLLARIDALARAHRDG